MRRSVVIAGESFGAWTVWEDARSVNNNIVAICRCACGLFKRVRAKMLKDGRTTKCHLCAISTHGMTKTPTWISWSSMHGRCTNQNFVGFVDYGGRGIQVCEEWASFDQFLRDMGERPADMTLDRTDVNGNYSKENCRWASKKVQAMNRRNTVWVEYEGEIYTSIDLARHLGINYHTLRDRIKRGTKLDRPIQQHAPKAKHA